MSIDLFQAISGSFRELHQWNHHICLKTTLLQLVWPAIASASLALAIIGRKWHVIYLIRPSFKSSQALSGEFSYDKRESVNS